MSVDFSGATGPGGVPYDPTGAFDRSTSLPSVTAAGAGGWFRKDAIGYEIFGGHQCMIAFRDDTNGVQAYVAIDPTGGNNFVELNIPGVGVTGSTSPMVLGAYNFVSASLDATHLTVFFNGVQIIQVANPFSATFTDIVFGSISGNAGLHTETFCGLITYDEVYSRALTAANWLTEMGGPTPPVSTTNIYAFLRMLNSGSAGTDTSGNGNNWTAIGAIVTQTAEPTFPPSILAFVDFPPIVRSWQPTRAFVPLMSVPPLAAAVTLSAPISMADARPAQPRARVVPEVIVPLPVGALLAPIPMNQPMPRAVPIARGPLVQQEVPLPAGALRSPPQMMGGERGQVPFVARGQMADVPQPVGALLAPIAMADLGHVQQRRIPTGETMAGPGPLSLSTTAAPITMDTPPAYVARRPASDMPAPPLPARALAHPIDMPAPPPWVPRRQEAPMPAPSFLMLSTTTTPIDMPAPLPYFARRLVLEAAVAPAPLVVSVTAMPLPMADPIRPLAPRAPAAEIASPGALIVTAALLPGVPEMPAPWRAPRFGRDAVSAPMFPLVAVTQLAGVPTMDTPRRWPGAKLVPIAQEVALPVGALLAPLAMADPPARAPGRPPTPAEMGPGAPPTRILAVPPDMPVSTVWRALRAPTIEMAPPAVTVTVAPLSMADVRRWAPARAPQDVPFVPPASALGSPVEMGGGRRWARQGLILVPMTPIQAALPTPPPGSFVPGMEPSASTWARRWTRPYSEMVGPEAIAPERGELVVANAILEAFLRVRTGLGNRRGGDARLALDLDLPPVMGDVRRGSIAVARGTGEPIALPIPAGAGAFALLLRPVGYGARVRITTSAGNLQAFPLSGTIIWIAASQPGSEATAIDFTGFAEVEYVIALRALF